MKDDFVSSRITAQVQAVTAEIARYKDHELDALVHDCASAQATAVNNNGRAAQVEYLLSNNWSGADIVFQLKAQAEDNE